MMDMMDLDENILFGCAFRYVLGRATYVVETFVTHTHKNWDRIPFTTKERMVKEIIEHRENAPSGMVGMECDDRQWQSIIERHINDKHMVVS
jgi:hypothetical protein